MEMHILYEMKLQGKYKTTLKVDVCFLDGFECRQQRDYNLSINVILEN